MYCWRDSPEWVEISRHNPNIEIFEEYSQVELSSYNYSELGIEGIWEADSTAIESFFDKKLSYFLCGYRKGYTTQYALLKLIENCKTFREDRGYLAALLMDLSKAFNTIKHDLLIAKLHA